MPVDTDEVIEHHVGLKFGQMSPAQKAVFMLKLVACICTFGFVFPNVQHD